MSRRQLSKTKRPVHKRSDRLQPAKLAQSLRSEWRREHQQPTNASHALRLHVERARATDLPSDVHEDSLVAQVRESYLRNRAEISPEIIAEIGARTASAAASQITFEEFVPDASLASAEELTDVARGIGIAKIALRQTMHG